MFSVIHVPSQKHTKQSGKVSSAIHEYNKIFFTIFSCYNIKTVYNSKLLPSKLVLAAVFVVFYIAFILQPSSSYH
jgi:hypothetical protein